MKIIKYVLCTTIPSTSETTTDLEEILSPVEIRCNEDVLGANEEIAKKEAHNGEYTIVDVNSEEMESER